MPFLASLALLFMLPQDRGDSYGKSNAQILAMGRKRWYDFYTGKAGESTAAMVGAVSLYGDALAQRNDRLGKGRAARLRKPLQDVNNDVVAVGSAMTGGGTMWNIVTADLYTNAEETLHAVLTKSSRAPRRKVSDVERAYADLRASFKQVREGATPADTKRGYEALLDLRKHLDRVVAEAKRQPRRESDALLDFCVRAMEAAEQGE